MTINSPVAKGLLVIFAVISVLAVLAFIGMFFMHGSMMGMMESSPELAAACQSMMAKSS